MFVKCNDYASVPRARSVPVFLYMHYQSDQFEKECSWLDMATIEPISVSCTQKVMKDPYE